MSEKAFDKPNWLSGSYRAILNIEPLSGFK
jgi:hypothetical protein